MSNVDSRNLEIEALSHQRGCRMFLLVPFWTEEEEEEEDSYISERFNINDTWCPQTPDFIYCF